MSETPFPFLLPHRISSFILMNVHLLMSDRITFLCLISTCIENYRMGLDWGEERKWEELQGDLSKQKGRRGSCFGVSTDGPKKKVFGL